MVIVNDYAVAILLQQALWELKPNRKIRRKVRPRIPHVLSRCASSNSLLAQEEVNGEKLTVKKWWIFGADFFTVWCRFFHGLRRFFTACKGHKR